MPCTIRIRILDGWNTNDRLPLIFADDGFWRPGFISDRINIHFPTRLSSSLRPSNIYVDLLPNPRF
jgi:hypothetical protein